MVGPRPKVRPVLLITTAVLVVGVSGCQSATETLVEDLTGADEVDLDDDGSFRLETEDGSLSFEADGEGGGTATFEGEDGTAGSFASTAGDLPEGFPAGIPLADGEVVGGSVVTGDGVTVWQAIISVPDLTVEDIGAACDALVDAGFTELQRTDLGGVVLCTSENADHGVGIQGATEGSDTIVYSVNDNPGG